MSKLLEDSGKAKELIKKNKKLSLNDFFKLPVKEQQDILSRIAAKANKDQQDLIKRYDKKFGKTKTASGCQFCDCK